MSCQARLPCAGKSALIDSMSCRAGLPAWQDTWESGLAGHAVNQSRLTCTWESGPVGHAVNQSRLTCTWESGLAGHALCSDKNYQIIKLCSKFNSQNVILLIPTNLSIVTVPLITTCVRHPACRTQINVQQVWAYYCPTRSAS